MYETFREVRHKLTDAQWDAVLAEFRGDDRALEVCEQVVPFLENVKTLLYHKADPRCEAMLNLFVNVWERNMVLAGYTFTTKIDTHEMYYREFTDFGQSYMLMVTFLNKRTMIDIRFHRINPIRHGEVNKVIGNG